MKLKINVTKECIRAGTREGKAGKRLCNICPVAQAVINAGASKVDQAYDIGFCELRGVVYRYKNKRVGNWVSAYDKSVAEHKKRPDPASFVLNLIPDPSAYLVDLVH